MANSVKFTAGTSNVPPTAGRLVADTSGGTVNLILPSIEELQNFQLRGSGFSVAGTFNFSFEKIGNGQLIFNVAKQDLETINGLGNLVINEIGSGIIFITSDLGWGITNFSQSNNQIGTNHTEIAAAAFGASRIDSPILLVPALADTLIIATHLVINITELAGSASTVVGYGYVGNKTLLAQVDLAGLAIGDTIIVPIVATKDFNLSLDPNGLGFGLFKVSGGDVGMKVRTVTFGVSVKF